MRFELGHRQSPMAMELGGPKGGGQEIRWAISGVQFLEKSRNLCYTIKQTLGPKPIAANA
jgi:hypothetical protein